MALVRAFHTLSSLNVVTVTAGTSLTDVIDIGSYNASCTLSRVSWVTDRAIEGSTSIALISFG